MRAAVLAGLAWLGLAPIPGANGQAVQRNVYGEALAVSERATSLAQAGRLGEAVDLLEDALLDCPFADAARDCRRVALYALGYVHQAAAEGQPGERERLLQQAAGYFQDVLAENPDYEAARRGLALVYRRMGAREWQESDLVTLARTDSTGRYQVVLGDYYRDHGRLESAETAYRRALELAPLDEQPRHRLLALYRSDNLDIRGLAPLLEQWEVRFPDLAAEGHQLIMRRVYPRDPLAAADALPRWLAALEALDRIGPGTADQIPEDWGAAPFASLRAYLLDPVGGEPSSWWAGREERGEALGAAALALGRWRLAEGQIREAEAVWQRGRSMAPPQWPSWIDLTAELALLYDRVPALDPGGSKFQALEKELFAGKGRAIGRRDYEAMLRFHGTLGVIYSRREVWGSTGEARSAIYQLDQALRAARDLRAETGLHEPLPDLRRRFAEALLGAGRTAAARTEFARAALAFLEMDDLAGAADMLRQAGGPGATRESRSLTESIGRWADLRSRVDAALGPEGEGVCDDGLLTRARTDARAGLDADEVVRQRFKVLADCAGRAGRAGPELAAAALEEVVSTGTPLVGVGDLTRLEQARRAVFGAFGQQVGPIALTRSAALRSGVVPLALPGADRGVYLEPGSDAALAARLVRELRPTDGALQLRIRNGEVTVIDPGRHAPAALDSLLTRAGVRQVRTRPIGA